MSRWMQWRAMAVRTPSQHLCKQRQLVMQIIKLMGVQIISSQTVINVPAGAEGKVLVRPHE